jgi:hypothetical protein
MRVWLVIQNDLPPLKAALRANLPPLNQLESELSGDNE